VNFICYQGEMKKRRRRKIIINDLDERLVKRNERFREIIMQEEIRKEM
jgi:hypothetical protein